MATLIFTALGTALGGPIGGALGSLIGNQIDRAVIGGPKREGPRLKELAVTTSSYGTPIARHFGTMRAAGTIIWSTDLVESSERSGGGKGRPSTATYSYSVSFAVALASRPIRRLGRVWADGNLLRGAAGDLKTGGELRVYEGHGDQPVDPLIASDRGDACPAFRGRAVRQAGDARRRAGLGRFRAHERGGGGAGDRSQSGPARNRGCPVCGGRVARGVAVAAARLAAWRLRGLLRGRGGTEEAAQAGHAAGAPFVLLDGRPLAIDPAKLDPADATSLAAIGLADDEPVIAAIANPGLTLRPLTPVHPQVQPSAGGGLILRWTRRARGAWTWPDGIETPLSEQAEAYTVGLGDIAQPALRWELAQPLLELSAATLAQLSSEHPGQPLWVRQVGSFATSAPLLLTTLD